MRPTGSIIATLCFMSLSAHGQKDRAACESLRTASDVSRTVRVEYDAATPEPTAAYQAPQPKAAMLPPHCRVRVTTPTSADSAVTSEIWLPESASWNGKLLGTGNGGYSSALSLHQMAEGLRSGYAVAGSDTGHEGDGLAFGVGHPEKIRDWAYRSTHVLATEAKAIAARFYGQSPSHSYFIGCSTGGQQGLSEAQRFPEDFDGIVAGDPGNDRTLLNADFVESWLVTHPSNGQPFPTAKLSLLNNAAIAACDGLDGIRDGILADPRACRFDPGTLACRNGAEGNECLTPAEVDMVRRLYEGPVRDSKGQPIFPGWPRGSEAGWGPYLVTPTQPVRVEFWSSWIFPSEPFDLHTFDAPAAIIAARTKLPFVEAVDADLRPFARRGGKLLLYHGWADAVVPPEDTVRYYTRVAQQLGNTTQQTVRLFMVPGMGHCGGGPGASSFDALHALDVWVTSDQPPESLLASHLEAGKPTFARPLCPYPQAARWDGQHDPGKAGSFACASTPLK